MAMVNVSAAFRLNFSSSLLPPPLRFPVLHSLPPNFPLTPFLLHCLLQEREHLYSPLLPSRTSLVKLLIQLKRRKKSRVRLFYTPSLLCLCCFWLLFLEEEKAKAKDLHPKLLAGMFFFFALGATGGVTSLFFFFALGATGGVTSLLTSDKPIFESPHAVTGFIGLSLLTIQTILPALFEGNPGLRTVHGILGSGIMTLFLVHAALGLRLGLSY